jgi:hypothetical protein
MTIDQKPGPFFILPDAQAGDTKDDVLISIDGAVYSLSAAALAELVKAGRAAAEQLQVWSEPASDNPMDQQQHDQITRYLQDALKPFSNDPTDFISTEACRANNI